jgi:hypothetical protein
MPQMMIEKKPDQPRRCRPLPGFVKQAEYAKQHEHEQQGVREDRYLFQTASSSLILSYRCCPESDDALRNWAGSLPGLRRFSSIIAPALNALVTNGISLVLEIELPAI